MTVGGSFHGKDSRNEEMIDQFCKCLWLYSKSEYYGFKDFETLEQRSS